MDIKKADGTDVGFTDFTNRSFNHEKKWKGRYIIEIAFGCDYHNYARALIDLKQAWKDTGLPGTYTFLERNGGRGALFALIEPTATEAEFLAFSQEKDNVRV